jgi:nucleoside 2-deoxyribosyltransferase
MDENTIIYCSGPLFCPEEKLGMEAVAKTLESAGYKTFLPQRDGLEPFVMGLANDPRVTNKAFRQINSLVHRAIFALDIYQVAVRCCGLVFNMNGRVPDEGAVVEASVAFAAGKPVILYKCDDRSLFNGYDNSMLLGLSGDFSTVKSLTAIPAQFEKLKAQIESRGGSSYIPKTMPPFMADTVAFGEKVWSFLCATKFFEAPAREIPARLKDVADLCRQ